MSDHETHVLIGGEPFLSRAKAYRDRHQAWRIAWSEYGKSKGATGHSTTGRCLFFDGVQEPEGWASPDSKHRSHPKKNHPDAAEMERMQAEHPEPKTAEVYRDTICYNLSYEGDGRKGSFAIGGFGLMINGPHVGWAADTFVSLIPDAEAAVREHLAAHPDRSVEEPAASWRLPEGLTRLSEAEYKLVFAQYAVEQERQKESPPPLPARSSASERG